MWRVAMGGGNAIMEEYIYDADGRALKVICAAAFRSPWSGVIDGAVIICANALHENEPAA